MGGWSAQWLVYAVMTFNVEACNVRELGNMIQQKFREEVAAQCGTIGDKCSFDRECCKGLECSMSASMGGLGLSCQRAWLKDPDRGDMVWEVPDSAPREPKSEDVDWMKIGRDSEEYQGEEKKEELTEENSEKMYPTDVLTEMENLQEKKELKLLRENRELEKLFTKKEEKELEELRALREDAEMDELRRLKELRLRRKIQLIKELKELRGLKAEEDLNTRLRLSEAKNANKSENELPTNNQVGAIESNYVNGANLDTVAELQTESVDAIGEPQEGGELPPSHKQGIHEAHHKRKHHHHKRKGVDATETLCSETPGNMTEYNAG